MKVTLYLVMISLFFGISAEGQSRRSGGGARPKPTPTPNQTFTPLLKHVVLVESNNSKGERSQGTGFYIGNGLVITNHHVVDGMLRGVVKRVDGAETSVPTKIKAVRFLDPKVDLALLEVDGYSDSQLPILEEVKKVSDEQERSRRNGLRLSALDSYEVGTQIAVLSNPIGLTGTLSLGIISGGLREIRGVNLLQIDAPISPGSSGGAVLNSQGEVIGVAVGSFSTGQNVNFAIPVNEVRSFLNRANIAPFNGVASAPIEGAWLVHRNPSPAATPAPAPTADSDNPFLAPNFADFSDSELRIWIEKNRDGILENEKFRHDVTFSFSPEHPCRSSYSSLFKNKSNDGQLRVLGKIDLSNSKPDGFKATGRVGFESSKASLMEMLSDGGVIYQMVMTQSVPMAKDIDKEIRLIRAFVQLARRCEGRTLPPLSGPSLPETQNWISGHLQGVSVINGSGEDLNRTRHQQLNFNGCQIVSRREVGIITYETRVDLRSLKQVELAKSKGGAWAVYLETYRNFSEESWSSYTRLETEMKSSLALLVPGKESGLRVAKAFARVLELCHIPEPKSPF